MIKLLITLLTLSTLSFAIEPIFKLENGEAIYACFNEIDNENETSFDLVIRNHKGIDDSFFADIDSTKKAVILVSMTKTSSSASFGVSPLLYEGKTKLEGPNEGWSPDLHEDTIYTARGNLRAISIQKKHLGFYFGDLYQFANATKDLICTTNKETAKALTKKAFEADPFKL